jgi:hypothetical protein
LRPTARSIDPATLPLRERPQAADTEQATEDQQNKTKLEARQASEFWRGLLRTAIGRREIYKLLTMVRAFESSPFAATPIGFPDPQATFLQHAGQIEQGRAVYQMLAIRGARRAVRLAGRVQRFRRSLRRAPTGLTDARSEIVPAAPAAPAPAPAAAPVAPAPVAPAPVAEAAPAPVVAEAAPAPAPSR